MSLVWPTPTEEFFDFYRVPAEEAPPWTRYFAEVARREANMCDGLLALGRPGRNYFDAPPPITIEPAGLVRARCFYDTRVIDYLSGPLAWDA